MKGIKLLCPRMLLLLLELPIGLACVLSTTYSTLNINLTLHYSSILQEDDGSALHGHVIYGLSSWL